MTHHKQGAGQWEESVAALMQQHVAVDALVALRPEAPYPASAVAAGLVLHTRTGEQGHVIAFTHTFTHAHMCNKQSQQRY